LFVSDYHNVEGRQDLNWRRYFLALGVTAVLTLVADVVLNAVVFREVYRRSASFLLPVHELNARVWLGWAALIVIVAAFGFLLIRGDWLGVRGGLQFGVILAVAGVAGVAGIASIVAWPAELLVAVGVQQFVNGLLLGVVFGVLYRPAHARPLMRSV
jgi:hypothetical protein